MSKESYDSFVLRISEEGPLRILTLDNPPGNVLSLSVLERVRTEAEAVAKDRAVRAILVESSVEGYFSSGLDLEELAKLPDNRRHEPFKALINAYRSLLGCPKPTVAALSGSAFLGGWILAMACDWRLLSSGAKVSLAEIRAGLSPTSGLIARLSALSLDPRTVKNMVLRGKSIGADEALASGLVDEILPEAQTRDAARTLARRLSKSPPQAFAEIKRVLNAASADDDLWRRSLAEFSELFSGAEAQEGVAALRAKRRPCWEDP